MSVKHSISDAVFRTKLYVGSAVLGGVLAAILYPLFLLDFPELNIVETVKLSIHVFNAERVSWSAAVASGAGLSFWLIWMLIARPWRGSDDPPDIAEHGVKKPW